MRDDRIEWHKVHLVEVKEKVGDVGAKRTRVDWTFDGSEFFALTLFFLLEERYQDLSDSSYGDWYDEGPAAEILAMRSRGVPPCLQLGVRMPSTPDHCNRQMMVSSFVYENHAALFSVAVSLCVNLHPFYLKGYCARSHQMLKTMTQLVSWEAEVGHPEGKAANM